MKTPVLLPVLSLALLISRLPAAQEVTVGADGGRLLAAPSPAATVVTSVGSGDRLTALEVTPDWVKVATPPGVKFWVYGELVRDGSVAVSKLGVRSGPGIVHPSIGSLQKGDRVEVQGSEGDWIQIAPSAGSGLWIRRESLSIGAGPAHTNAVKPPETEPSPLSVIPAHEEQSPPAVEPVRVKPRPAPPAPVEVETKIPPVVPLERPAPVRPPVRPSVRAQPEPQPPAVEPPARDVPASPAAQETRPGEDVARGIPGVLEGAPLVGSKEQGQSVHYSGTIVRSGPVWRWPSSYALVRHDENGRPVLVCYIMGNPAKLYNLLGRRATLYGDEYWVQGVRRPVVAPQRVVLRR